MKISLLLISTLLFSAIFVLSCKKDDDTQDDTTVQTGTVKDIENNSYNTIKIGTQWWMCENLKSTKYRDNSAIEFPAANAATWTANTTGAFAWYDNNPANKSTYGALYNWYAVKNTSGLCPTGWHVPSDADWDVLSNYLGGNTSAGGKLKTQGTTYWFEPNQGASNSSGFKALPGGWRFNDGSYNNVRYFGYWWSSTEQFTATAWYRSLYYNDSQVSRNTNNKSAGFSVRCVKD